MATKPSNWPYVINLGNSIIGVSVLAMPFCFKQCGVVLGMLLLMMSAFLTYTACILLIRSAIASRRRSYEFLALHTFGAAGKLAVEVSIIGLLVGTCIAFYVIIGDLGPAIVSKVMGIENTSSLRTYLMVVLGVTIALPLGMMRNVESLSSISALSIGFYFVFVTEIFTTAFPNLWSGIWVTKVVFWNPEGVFKCLPIFSLAFACQTQLFVMYDALPEASLKRMTLITRNAITFCFTTYLLVGYFGYVAFCDDDVSGDMLLNFRPTIISESVKFGFVLSIAVSFPLAIFPLRASIYTLLFTREQSSYENLPGSTYIPEPHFRFITAAIVLSTLVVGIFVPNIEFILAITGATMGSMICFIFPAVMFIHIMSTKTNSKSMAQLVLFLGVTILLASTYVTLNTQDKMQPVDSVIKVAPVEENNLAKEEVLPDNKPPEIKIEPPIDEIKKSGDDVIKDAKEPAEVKDDQEKTGVKDEKQEENKEDKRQEPPNPHAPVDDEKDEKKEDADLKKVEDGNKEVVNKEEKEDNKKADTAEEHEENDKKDVKEKQDEDKNNVDIQEKEDKTEKTKKKESTNGKVVNAEAKNLLAELKEQRVEQKKLIEEQKQIIEDLKQHQKDAHADQQQKEDTLQQQQQFQQQPNPDVPQQQLAGQGQPVAPKQAAVDQQILDSQQAAQPNIQQQQQQLPAQQQQQQVPAQQQQAAEQQPLQQQEPVKQMQQQAQVQQQMAGQQQQAPVQPQQQQEPAQQLPEQQQQQVPMEPEVGGQQPQATAQPFQQQVAVNQLQEQHPVQQQPEVPGQHIQQQQPQLQVGVQAQPQGAGQQVVQNQAQINLQQPEVPNQNVRQLSGHQRNQAPQQSNLPEDVQPNKAAIPINLPQQDPQPNQPVIPQAPQKVKHIDQFENAQPAAKGNSVLINGIRSGARGLPNVDANPPAPQDQLEDQNNLNEDILQAPKKKLANSHKRHGKHGSVVQEYS